MIDYSNKYLIEIEQFLKNAVEYSGTLDESDIDPREITYQMTEQVKQSSYNFQGMRCVPNIITVSIPETKADKVEDVETIFNAPRFLELFDSFLADHQARLFNPLRVDVQTVSKGNSRVMFGRAGLALDWPGPELATEFVRVELDPRTRRIVAVHPPL